MSQRFTSPGKTDLPRQDIALGALKEIRAVLDGLPADAVATEEIDYILTLAYARLRMAGNRQGPRANLTWLAKVVSFCVPMRFMRPNGKGDAPYLCFVVEVTEGAQSAVGRKIEVQLPAADAARLATQMANMVKHFGDEVDINKVIAERSLDGLLSRGEGAS